MSKKSSKTRPFNDEHFESFKVYPKNSSQALLNQWMDTYNSGELKLLLDSLRKQSSKANNMNICQNSLETKKQALKMRIQYLNQTSSKMTKNTCSRSACMAQKDFTTTLRDQQDSTDNKSDHQHPKTPTRSKHHPKTPSSKTIKPQHLFIKKCSLPAISAHQATTMLYDRSSPHTHTVDTSTRSIKHRLAMFDVSDCLRQRICNILDDVNGNRIGGSDDQKVSQVMLQRFNCSDRDKMFNSPKTFKSSDENNSMFMLQSHAIEDIHIFPFVITKPPLTGDKAFSDPSLGQAMFESDSNMRDTLDFTQVSPVQQRRFDSPSTVVSPGGIADVRLAAAVSHRQPIKRLTIRLNDSGGSESDVKDGKWIDGGGGQEKAKVKGFGKSGRTCGVFETSGDLGVEGSERNDRVEGQRMVCKSTQTSHHCGKSIGVQVDFNEPIQDYYARLEMIQKLEDVKTFRRDEMLPLKKYCDSEIFNDVSSDNHLSIVKPLNVNEIHDECLHKKISSENVMVNGFPGYTPANENTARSNNDVENKKSLAGNLNQQRSSHFQFKTPEQVTPNKPDSHKIASLASPIKKARDSSSKSEKGSPSSKSKKPQIMNDPSKVISAKVSTFRTPRSQHFIDYPEHNENRVIMKRLSQPELISFSDKDLLESPNKGSPERTMYPGTVTGAFTSCYSPYEHKGRYFGPKKTQPTNLIPLKDVSKDNEQSRGNNHQIYSTQPNRQKTKPPPTHELSFPQQSNPIPKESTPKSTQHPKSVTSPPQILYDFNLLNNDELAHLDTFRLSSSNLYTLRESKLADRLPADQHYTSMHAHLRPSNNYA